MARDADRDGHDTALARWLLARGVVDLTSLRACLEEVRRRRGAEAVDLPTVLLARGCVTRADLEAAETIVGSAVRGAVVPAAAEAPPPERRLAGCRVVRELARGGMGVVYEVEDATGARRALKTLRLAGAHAEELLRFRREAELLARLDHPAIVRVHAAALDGPTPCIVQDLLPGGSLEARLEGGPLPVAEAVAIAAHLARGLAHAHARGVLHRDLKPRNVVFDERGAARLVDLGLARPVDASSLTASGALLGTPAYLPPEQAAGRPADARTDVWGLGAVLYAMLAGRAPYAGLGGQLATLAAALRGAPPPLRTLRPDVPAAVEAVVGQAMAVDPGARFPSAAALADALEAAARDPGPPRRGGRPAARLAGALVGLILLAAAGLAARGPAPTTTAPAAPTTTAPTAPARDDPLAAARAALARADAARAAGAPVRAEDVAALAAGVAAADLAQVEALAAHAAQAGLAGEGGLEAARALAAACPASAAAAALRGLEACARGDPATRREATEALARGRRAGDVARVTNLLDALALADQVAAGVTADARPAAQARQLAQVVRRLADDPRLPGAPALILTPVGAAVRAALRSGTLGGVVDDEPLPSLLGLVAAAGPRPPPVLVAALAVNRDFDERQRSRSESEIPADRIEAAARALRAEDPLLAAVALQLAARRRFFVPAGEAPVSDPAVARAVLALEVEAQALAAVAAPRALGTAERSILVVTLHRGFKDRRDLEQWLADVERGARREHLARALAHAAAAWDISARNGELLSARRIDTEKVAELGLELGELAVIEARLEWHHRPEALRAELLRRRGRPAAALEALAAAPRGDFPAYDLAVEALALADLGRFAEARVALGRLRVEEDRGGDFQPHLGGLRGPAVEAHIAAAEARAPR